MKSKSIGALFVALAAICCLLINPDFSTCYVLEDASVVGGGDCTHSEKHDATCDTSTDPNNTDTCPGGTYHALSTNDDAGLDHAHVDRNACPANGCKYHKEVTGETYGEAPIYHSTAPCIEQPPATPEGEGEGGEETGIGF